MRPRVYVYVVMAAVFFAIAFSYLRFFRMPAGQGAQVAEGLATGTKIAINPSGTHINLSALGVSVPPPAGYVAYRNKTYGFSFYHEPDSQIKEYDEGGGAMTVVLENLHNPQRARGMQVFIVPYASSTISEARFRMDEPSGVRTNVENAMVDGVRAVTFNSYDTFLGDTREIWFIHGGYLFEVTTLQGVANWFTPIIQSWAFLN